MNIGTVDILHIIIALTLLLFFSHTCGYLFQRYRQPRVIGEILGGIILGPTLLGYFFPEVYSYIFHAPATRTFLNIIYQLGLLHLMFLTGMELRSKIRQREKVAGVTASIALFGTVLPFVAGFIFVRFVDIQKFIGTANDERAFILIFSIAVAITSIPVISRILHDLKLLQTSFAKIILSAAVFEDIILYVVLTVAIGMVGGTFQGSFGLPTLLGLEGRETLRIVYHSLSTLIFFGISLWIGPRLFRWFSKTKLNILISINPLAFLISFMLLMTGAALLLDITPMFGAFVAGIVAQSFREKEEETQDSFEIYSLAFFIPIYFAIVGLRLDLVRAFNPLFFLVFLGVACLIKWTSVYIGARVAKESNWGALNLAIAMNARGGPGIVLASLALDANIINEAFYCNLVMLAIITSLLAGSWLDYIARKKLSLR